jgi:hypothetical protein
MSWSAERLSHRHAQDAWDVTQRLISGRGEIGRLLVPSLADRLGQVEQVRVVEAAKACRSRCSQLRFQRLNSFA